MISQKKKQFSSIFTYNLMHPCFGKINQQTPQEIYEYRENRSTMIHENSIYLKDIMKKSINHSLIIISTFAILMNLFILHYRFIHIV